MPPPVTLTEDEARVVGALMEKCVTTPDNYPLSLNGLLTACNQTTNRDPIVRFGEDQVERALESLRDKGLSRRIKTTGQRVVKHRQTVDETLKLTAPEFSILGVLLLRGAQTPGELKGRTERWHTFRSLDDVEASLQRLAAGEFVVQLPRRPGQKEQRWMQLLSPSHEPTVAYAPSGPRESPVSTPARPAPTASGPAADAAPEPAMVPAPEAHSIEIRNPATGEVVRTVAITEPGEIEQKMKRARRAQPAWAARPYEERAAALRAFRDLLAAEADECAALTTTETGKPVTQARNEVRAVLERIDWNVEHAGAVVSDRTVTRDAELEERVSYEPVGVVAHISAWNYPYFVALNSIVPALLTGNAVLYKPSEHATLTGLRIVDVMHRAGIPVDIVQTVVGSGPTGAALVASDVDMICFTGSYATGRQVGQVAAERMARVQLELGGKDAAYVCDDVDVDSAALAVAEGAFYNCGQSCSATERVYVHEAVWDRFVATFTDVVRGYQVGDPTDTATDIGPLARAEQLDVIQAQVADALAKGAQLAHGGEVVARPGAWYTPTVLVGVNHAMTLVREETFGPVIGLQRVRDDDEAIALIDDTDYGLGAAVFTASRERAERILGRLDVGNAYWNTADRSTVRLPWAGRRHSGTGSSMSESGVRAFVREKAWHLKPA